MNAKLIAKTVITAATLAAAFVAGQAQASGPKDSSIAGDKYGYVFRTDARDAYTDGARSVDQFTDGARAGKFDTFTDGARTVAGLDRSGVSATPARSGNRDAFTDGARTGKFDVFTEGANA
ncbi:hypothetical protein ACKI2N_009390 [Cupriavidus sp. 30B13]|uniref:hypothetical protein n=1 Tax=Cupriavidus sp. 30B13 TaxID=3384241 RepID=UPI003B8F55C2